MTTKKPLLIAHRGNTKKYHENSIAAFESAFKLGADGIEFDIHLNNKGEVIVVHDYLHSQKKHPLLADVFEQFGSQGRMEVEIKSLELTAITKVKELINKYQIRNFELTTSVVPLVSHLRDNFPQARIGLIFRRLLIEDWMTPDFKNYWIQKHLELSGANVLHLDLDLYTPQLVDRLHQQKIILHTHLSTADRQKWEHCQQLGLDQCTFDDPAILKW